MAPTNAARTFDPIELELLWRRLISAVDEADDGPGLVPVQKSHQPAIAFINEICRREMERFRREMAGITLARLRAEKDRKRRPAKPAKRKPARAKARGGR